MADKKNLAPARQKRCFMITPIGEAGSEIRKHADWVFRFAIKPVMTDKGFEATRADMMDDPFMINDSVFAAIDESEICVADLTNLNANVFYELGVRHALEKPVIHIAHVGTRIPFDTANYRTIWFDLSDIDSMESLRTQLAAHVDTICDPKFKLSNPLTQARGFQRAASSADPTEKLVAALEDRLNAVERELREPARTMVASRNSGLFGSGRASASLSLSDALSHLSRTNAEPEPAVNYAEIVRSLGDNSEEQRRLKADLDSLIGKDPGRP